MSSFRVKFPWGNSFDGNFWGSVLSLNKIDCPDNLKMRLWPIFDCSLWKFIMQSNSSAFARCRGLKTCCAQPKIQPDPLSCFSWFWQSSNIPVALNADLAKAIELIFFSNFLCKIWSIGGLKEVLEGQALSFFFLCFCRFTNA